MTTISALIDFLMSLMRDEDTQRAFAKNPDGTLADKGLRDVTVQDVRDARLIMADDGAVRPRPDGAHQSGYHDGGLTGGGGGPVREILHTTNTFEIDQSKHIDQTIITFDNRDTTIIDSFNSADEVTAIQDNDTINTEVDVVNVADSFNDDDTEPAEDQEPVGGEPVVDPADDVVTIQPVDDEPGEDVPIEPEPGLDPGDGTGPLEPEAGIQPVEDDPELADTPIA
ncbi:IniB N-terminal domain-containing protein [Actinophytocola sp.]|uniref:IniB N-terminal domain-containing protein n=1 Tax=Actinophytocola sp. TaxID=1872138 RepID=UPI003D6BA973